MNLSREPAIPDKVLRRELKRNGWIGKQSVTPEQLKRAVQSYQRRFGLKVDGWAGPITSRTLTERFCGCPDHALEARSAWDKDQAREGLTWAIPEKLTGSPKMSAGDYKQVVTVALAHISTVCGARFVYSANARTANVVMGTHRERSGGVLAWSQLPNGSGSQLEQSYDDAERWHWENVSPASGTIGLIHVIRHEWGHALGLGHGGDWLLRPTYDPRAYTFRNWEAKEVVARYGPPQDVPPVDPPPGPGGTRELRLIVKGDFTWEWEKAE